MSARPTYRDGGFTLLELLVVLLVMALVAVITVPRIGAALPGAELKSAARQLAAGLREARSRAVAKNHVVPFTLDGTAGRYFIGTGGANGRMPNNIGITLITGTVDVSGAASGSIRFFPDGTSTGGRIELTSRGGKRTVIVDWLTGRIAVGR